MTEWTVRNPKMSQTLKADFSFKRNEFVSSSLGSSRAQAPLVAAAESGLLRLQQPGIPKGSQWAFVRWMGSDGEQVLKF